MADSTRIELTGALAGHYVMIDPDELTFGLLEDLQSGQFKSTLDGLAAAIVASDVPKLTIIPLPSTPEEYTSMLRNGLRRLKVGEGQSVLQGVVSAFEIPKR